MLKKDENNDLVWGPGYIGSMDPRDDGRWTDTSRHYFVTALSVAEKMFATEQQWAERVKVITSDDPLPADPEDYVLPFIYLARHAVELLLKSMELGLARWERRAVDIETKDHSLKDRWPAAEQFLDAIGDGGVREQFKELVEILDKLDPDSYATRYPASKRWVVPQLLVGERIRGVWSVPFVNVSLIARLLRAVWTMTYISDELEHAIECRYEMEREYASYSDY